MTDLLTHIIVVYIALTVWSWWRPHFTRAFIPIGMIGAILPDIAKINYIVSAGLVSNIIGLPFSWLPFHRIGGIILVSGVIVLLFEPQFRRKVFKLLLFGGVSHLFLDALIKRANGTTPPYFYPLSWWRPPAGSLYLSSDIWPVLLAIFGVGILFVVRRISTSIDT